MSFTDEEIKRAASTKEWIEERIAELEGQIEKLRETLLVVDSILKRTSFRRAAEIPPTAEETAEETPPTTKKEIGQVSEVRQIRRSKGGPLIANAYVSSESVSIVPTTDAKLSTNTPPFKTFFVNRILEGMKQKDKEIAEKGQISADNMAEYSVDEKDGMIEKIVIKNYRDKQRLDEIINTATWAFSRMLEKKA
ncbi:MAG: hypothetical protein FJ358_01965 [Thaumarchaeota archaeon]|nr:hypothetical protein [Nitrososphaerota archaeon]